MGEDFIRSGIDLDLLVIAYIIFDGLPVLFSLKIFLIIINCLIIAGIILCGSLAGKVMFRAQIALFPFIFRVGHADFRLCTVNTGNVLL